jgi:hypothetical protein
MSDQNDAKDMSGVILQGLLDEGDTEKIVEVVENLHHRFIGDPEPVGGANVGLIVGGVLVGVAAGGAAGYIFAKRQLETKYSQIAADEIAEMREHFYAKEVAREQEAGKGDLEDIVKSRGYATPPDEEEEATAPPMAVTPPEAVVERAEEVRDEEAETPPAPEEDPAPETRNIFRDAPPQVEPDEWDWHKERAQRSPLRPYIIHRDEREDNEAYDGVTYTYYEADDVVCNERDEVIGPEDRETIFGESVLEKFGHGSGDAAVVYVRNDKLEMDIEIVHSPNSYAEEVHGFEPEIKHSDRRRGRASFDDE